MGGGGGRKAEKAAHLTPTYQTLRLNPLHTHPGRTYRQLTSQPHNNYMWQAGML